MDAFNIPEITKILTMFLQIIVVIVILYIIYIFYDIFGEIILTVYNYLYMKFIEIIKIVNDNPDLNKYDLLKNMGYATLKHRNAILAHGIHDLHRKTFSSCIIKQSDL